MFYMLHKKNFQDVYKNIFVGSDKIPTQQAGQRGDKALL